MISFDNGGARFNYRVAGVALNGDRVLIHRAEIDDFWALPGGRVEILETAEHALVREMKEEINVEVSVGRLLWVVENFFEYDDNPYHELGLYFLMTLPEDSGLYETETFEGKEDYLPGLGRNLKLIFEWQPLTILNEVTVVPEFLQTALHSIPTTPQHIVQYV